MDRKDHENSASPPKPTMLMSHTSFINFNGALRSRPRPQRPPDVQHMPPALPSSPRPVDVGSLNVEFLLGDDDGAREQRRTTESLQGYPAKQAANALQQWMSIQNSPLPKDLTRWHRAYDVLNTLVNRSGQPPEQLLIGEVIVKTEVPIAKGSYGDVFRGVHGRDHRQRKTVAVKLPSKKDKEVSQRFWREALIWHQLQHENIIALKGIYIRRQYGEVQPCMISSWVDGGTIIDFAKSSDFNHRRQRVPLLSGVAQGLLYLHERGLIHGDFHAGNILVHEGRALLADFGLTSTVVGDESRPEDLAHEIPAPGHGAINWLAPELLAINGGPTPPKTMAGDIFGFGRLCLAICTNGVIFPNMSEHKIKSQLPNGLRPSKPELLDCGGHVPMSKGLWALAEDCWKPEPEGRRPSSSEVLQRLQSREIYM